MELICRDEIKLDKYIAMSDLPKPTTKNNFSEKILTAAQIQDRENEKWNQFFSENLKTNGNVIDVSPTTHRLETTQ